MKIKSEFYTQELTFILLGINLQMRDIVKTMKREKRKAVISCIFAPWVYREIWTAYLFKMQALMKYTQDLSDLRDKIMSAEGVDEDMRPITFAQMCENPEN